MSKLPLKDMKGKQQGEYDLADELLVYDKGGQAVHDAVVAHRAKCRAGSASTKTRAEVSGSGTKPWKQKGLGRARSGTKRNPVWRGGGIIFGPKPRSYAKGMPKKVAKLAFRRAFSEKVAAGEVEVIDQIAVSQPRTREFVDIMKNIGVDRLTLVLVGQMDANLKMAARNVARIDLKTAADVSTYDLLRYHRIVVDQEGMKQIEQRLGAKGDQQ